MKRTRRSALIACAILALTACYAVPDTGPVREGLTNLEQSEREVRYRPNGPAKGAGQEAIVRGFMLAASSHTNDYETARQFLTPAYATTWDPWIGVLVDTGERSYAQDEHAHAVFTLNVLARIDAHGTMTSAEPADETKVRFELKQVNGEWRIASAPNGIILDSATFSSVWTTRALYFFTPDHRLAAESRWFLNRDTLVTHLIRALLGGPSETMRGALLSALAPGTTLSSTTVPVIDGIALVDLSTELIDADETTIDKLQQQIASTLQSLVGVTGFQILLRGTVLSGGDVATAEESTITEYQYAAVLQAGNFGIAGVGTLRPLPILGDRVVALEPKAVTVTPDLSMAAVLHESGVTQVDATSTTLLDERAELLPPSIDTLGYVWTYSQTAPTQIWVSSPNEEHTVLQTPWLEEYQVVAVRVSVGGNRIAALLEEAGGTVVKVAGIVRNQSGKPIGLTEIVTTQLWEPGAPIDLDWISDTRFAVLSQSGILGGSSRITIGEVGGRFAVSAGTVPGGIAMSGGGGRTAMLRVLDDQHRMFAPQGNAAWQQLFEDIDLIAKVG